MLIATTFLTLFVGAISAETLSDPWPPKALSPADNNILEMTQLVSNSSLPSGNSLAKREDGGVYICTDVNWQGTCGFAKQPWNECIQLTSPYWQTISSIGPDAYNALVAYSDFSCSSSDVITIFNPGYSDLRTVNWNDRIGSFKVYQIAGTNCLKGTPNLPDTNCNDCCNGCTQGGQDCCPDGAFC